MRFFFDNCVSPYLAKAFRALLEPENHTVQHIQDRYPLDHFPDGVEDVVWIRDLSAEGQWIVISRDSRIVRNPHEKRALLEGDLIVYVLAAGWRHQSRWAITWALMRWWENLMVHASQSPRKAVYQLPFRYSQKADAIKQLL